MVLQWLADIGNVDGFGADDLFWWSVGLTAVIGLLVAVARIIVGGWHCIHKLTDYAEAGDKKLDDLQAEVLLIRAQVYPNGGLSINDKVSRIEANQAGMKTSQADIKEDIENLSQRLDRHIDAQGG